MQSFLLGGDMPRQNVGFIHMTGKGRMDLGGGAAASVSSPVFHVPELPNLSTREIKPSGHTQDIKCCLICRDVAACGGARRSRGCYPLHAASCKNSYLCTCAQEGARPFAHFHSQALFVLSLGGSRELIQGPKSVSCGESDPSGLLMLRPGPRAHRSSAVFGFDRSAPTALPGMSLGGCAVICVVCEEEEEEGGEAGS